MKNKGIALVMVLMVAMTTCYSQSLDFNRVYNLKGQVGASSTYFALDTVPAGKTWKIENYGVTGYTGLYMHITGNTYLPMNIVGGSNPVYLAPAPGNGSVSGLSRPIWMEAGEVIYGRNSVTTGSYWISILEFNVTP